MSLIVEDGTGLANAESYTSVAEADTYHGNLGNTAWAALTTAAKEANLRKATNYLVQVYRQRWKGYRAVTTQALDWPRQNVPIDDVAPYGAVYVANNIVPPLVKNACADMALKANSGDLAPDIDREVVRVKVGPIEKQYAEHVPLFKQYRAIDLALKPYLKCGGSEMLRG